MKGNNAMGWSKLNSIREEVIYYLLITTFITQDLLKVVLVKWFLHYRAQYVNLFKQTVACHQNHTFLDHFDTVEVIIVQRKGIILELSLVHEITNESHHTPHLAMRYFKLFLYSIKLFDVALDHLN